MAGGLTGRRVLVTGASSGIGAAVARAIVAEGGKVALLARRADKLTALATELGGAATVVACDIADDAVVPRAVDDAAAKLGGLDAVVNSAGRFSVGPVADTDPAAWRAMFDVNVIGLLNVTKAAVPHLRDGTAPTVVNISSLSGRRVPRASSGVYSATKFAVHALGDGLRMELAPRGIRVTTFAPGLVDTDITADWPDTPENEQFRERLRTSGLPLEAVAEGVVHVLSRPAQVNIVEYAVMSINQ